MSGDLVIGIDASTTACKAIVFDPQGDALAEGRAPIALHNPEPDAWEQDAEDWWRALVHAVTSATAALGPDRAQSIAGIAIANQRETFVVTDDAGQPLHPALVWMDARARGEVLEAVAAFGGDHLHETTGKPACVTPSFYKALFLLTRKEPALAKKQPRLLDVHGFLAWRLTGEFATSIPAADPLGLIDLRKNDWSDDLLAFIGLDRARVPRLVAPGAALGNVLPALAAQLGLPNGVVVYGGAGDGQAAGLGAGIASVDRAYLNLGTAIVSGVLSSDYRLDRGFRTLAGALPGTYFLESDLKGGTFTIGWLLDKWLRAAHPGKTDEAILAELDLAARDLPPGANGLMVLPYWNGVMNPYWDDDATGLVVGFRGDHGPAHLYRAILEGIAFEERLHASGIEGATRTRIREFVLMGGGAKSDLFCRIVADVLDRRVVRSKTPEATALGAAMLAAIGAGIHATAANATAAMTSDGLAFEPTAARAQYERLYRDVYEGLYPEIRKRIGRLRTLAG